MSIIRRVDVYFAFVLALNSIGFLADPSRVLFALLLVNVLLWLWIRSKKLP